MVCGGFGSAAAFSAFNVDETHTSYYYVYIHVQIHIQIHTNYDLKHRQGTQIDFKTQRYKSTITKKSAAKKSAIASIFL